MLIESLPTGIDTPSAGHSSIPTACTASNSAASSPGVPTAAIQLADSLISLIDAIDAAAMLVIASATAMRADAGALSTASGVRSPIAIASPAGPTKSRKVTAQSATGTCHGPTICSRAVRPPTKRSPMVMRNVLSATVGCCNTRYAASRSLIFVVSNTDTGAVLRTTVRSIFGGFPSNTSSGMSTGLLLNFASATVKFPDASATPTTANGQRSRAQNALNWVRLFGVIAST